MSTEAHKNHVGEVIFEAEDFGRIDYLPPKTDVVSERRDLIVSTLVPNNNGEHPVYHEVIDLPSTITKFIQDLEAIGKFKISDSKGNLRGAPKQMPKELAEKIYIETINEIMLIYQKFPPEMTIFELLDGISSIDVFLSKGEIDISIFSL